MTTGRCRSRECLRVARNARSTITRIMFDPRASAQAVFRKSAMWAYAFNQSRAKVLMDPIYLAVARRILEKETPLSRKLASEKFEGNLFLAYRTQSRRLQY